MWSSRPSETTSRVCGQDFREVGGQVVEVDFPVEVLGLGIGLR